MTFDRDAFEVARSADSGLYYLFWGGSCVAGPYYTREAAVADIPYMSRQTRSLLHEEKS